MDLDWELWGCLVQEVGLGCCKLGACGKTCSSQAVGHRNGCSAEPLGVACGKLACHMVMAVHWNARNKLLWMHCFPNALVPCKQTLVATGLLWDHKQESRLSCRPLTPLIHDPYGNPLKWSPLLKSLGPIWFIHTLKLWFCKSILVCHKECLTFPVQTPYSASEKVWILCEFL